MNTWYGRRSQTDGPNTKCENRVEEVFDVLINLEIQLAHWQLLC